MSFLLVLPAVPFVLAALAYFHFRNFDGWWPRLAAGAGWVALWALPGVLFQVGWIFFSGQTSYSITFPEYARVAPIAWWVLIGGHTVQTAFEAAVPSRTMTMLTEWHIYYAFVWAQTLLLAALVAWRLSGRPGVKDPLLLAVAAFSLVNAWLGKAWPWWGS